MADKPKDEKKDGEKKPDAAPAAKSSGPNWVVIFLVFAIIALIVGSCTSWLNSLGGAQSEQAEVTRLRCENIKLRGETLPPECLPPPTATPNPDSDGDGVQIPTDRCPQVWAQTANGCPPPTLTAKQAADAEVARIREEARVEAERIAAEKKIADAATRNAPPPLPDSDGDGVVDVNDLGTAFDGQLCKNVPGPLYNGGCPLPPTEIPPTPLPTLTPQPTETPGAAAQQAGDALRDVGHVVGEGADAFASIFRFIVWIATIVMLGIGIKHMTDRKASWSDLVWPFFTGPLIIGSLTLAGIMEFDFGWTLAVIGILLVASVVAAITTDVDEKRKKKKEAEEAAKKKP